MVQNGDPISKVLEMGQLGFKRNGDLASWKVLKADIFIMQKKYPQAINELKDAWILTPEREDIGRNLALAYYNVGELAKAALAAEKAATLAPFSPDYQHLAQQLRNLASQEKEKQ